jgi:glycosyltransferase involved in cell wall biosynthesis
LYNEAEFIQTVLERVISAPLPAGLEREIIVVDDASTDGSPELVEDMAERHPNLIRLIRGSQNRGIGAAIRTAIEHATGDYSLIQDADRNMIPTSILCFWNLCWTARPM